MMATRSMKFKLLGKTIMDQIKPKEKRILLFFIYKEKRVKYFKTSWFQHPLIFNFLLPREYQLKKVPDDLFIWNFNTSCGFVYACLISISLFFVLEINKSSALFWIVKFYIPICITFFFQNYSKGYGLVIKVDLIVLIILQTKW